MITNQKELRAAFWEQYPEFKRKGTQKQNAYPVDIRMAWCAFVEHMERENEITADLAQRATL